MKGIQGAGRTFLISIAITIAASVLGVLFNMVNPKGIEIVKERQEHSAYKATAADGEKDVDSSKTHSDAAVVVSESSVAADQKVEVSEQASSIDSAEVSLTAIAETEQYESPTESTDEAAATTEIELITLFEAKEYFDKGDGFFVDARSEYKYYELHIPGALSLSASRFDSQYEEFKDTIAKDALLIIYCHSITCPYSDIVASKLRGFGYTNIKIFAGGWTEWLRARYPVQGFKVYS